MRQKIHRPLTAHALGLALRRLGGLRAQGFAPEEVLDQSTFNAWQGLFPIKEADHEQRKSFRQLEEDRGIRQIERFVRSEEAGGAGSPEIRGLPPGKINGP
jgi:hypothetical protein